MKVVSKSRKLYFFRLTLATNACCAKKLWITGVCSQILLPNSFQGRTSVTRKTDFIRKKPLHNFFFLTFKLSSFKSNISKRDYSEQKSQEYSNNFYLSFYPAFSAWILSLSMQAQWQFSNHWVSGKSLHYKNIQEHCFLFVQIEFSQKKHTRIFLYACSLATSFNEVVDVKLRINHRVEHTTMCMNSWTAKKRSSIKSFTLRRLMKKKLNSGNRLAPYNFPPYRVLGKREKIK